MPDAPLRAKVPLVTTDVRTRSLVTSLVLEEFRLRSPELVVAAAQIVATFSGIESTLPLLTSIDDPRDVAAIWALHAGEGTAAVVAQRTKLDPLVEVWRPLKHYKPRIAEWSHRPPTYYRLAVTESGINDTEPVARAATPSNSSDAPGPRPLGLLWIGAPLGTHAGRLILVGGADDASAAGRDPGQWPLSLSRSLGVRIYEGLP
jgi:hypothetical protein